MNYLIVLLGPTGVGKTHASIRLAQTFSAPILSADSRQLYKGIEIGTAAPTDAEKTLVKHYFVGTKDLQDYYSAGQYEEDVLLELQQIFAHNPYALLVGGSMMYIDAVCKGMDAIPSVDDETRQKVLALYQEKGLEGIVELLKIVDPEHCKKVDFKNTRRVMHAVEVSLMTGKPYSSLLTNTEAMRDFTIIKIGLTRPREELYARINERVEIMFEQGLESEARKLHHFKELNALNTVGYKEIMDYIDGNYPSIEVAKEKIKQHSRQYAKRQLTWFNKDKSIQWFHPDDVDSCITYINTCVQDS